MAWYQITVNDNDGSGSAPSSFYYHDSKPFGYYKSKSAGTSNIFSGLTTIPTRTYYEYLGHYTAKSGGMKLINANGNCSSICGLFSSAATIYAIWKRLSYTLTLDKSSGTGGTTTLYGKATEGGWFTNWKCTSAATSITPPTRAGCVFMGYYSGQQGTGSGFTKYTNADGTFTDAMNALVLTSNATFYAWWKVRREITVEANGGTGGTGTFYYVPTDGAFYADAACTNAITAITPPTKTGTLFAGAYDTDETTGTQLVAEDGTISTAWTPGADVTIYAQWRTVATITFDKGDGESGDDGLVYDSADGEFHIVDDPQPTDEVTPPNFECHRFLGYFSAASGGTQYIDMAGQITNALRSLSISGNFTVYAQWEFVSYKATLDPGDGAADVLSFYCDGAAATFYVDDLLAGTPITSVTPPTRAGYDFGGYYTDGDAQAVNASGEIVCGAFSADMTLHAVWTIRSYTLSFDYNGGSGSTQTKSVTWQTAVGTLPTPTPPREDAVFEGWKVDGVTITSATVWTIDGSAVARAEWLTMFSSVVDYFGLASSALVPIASDSGDTKHRVSVSHGGKYEAGVVESGGIWRNPSVTYIVKENTTVNIQLGKAYAATYTGTGSNRRMTVSGYMIVSVEIQTAVGSFPTVIVTATANEGANAVNNFTENVGKFNVSVPVVARSKAQNLLGALEIGGLLQNVAMLAACDPVICEEYLMPSASDIVNGRYEMTAEVIAPGPSYAPAMASAAGFELTDSPKATRDADYIRFTVSARKEMS